MRSVVRPSASGEEFITLARRCLKTIQPRWGRSGENVVTGGKHARSASTGSDSRGREPRGIRPSRTHRCRLRRSAPWDYVRPQGGPAGQRRAKSEADVLLFVAHGDAPLQKERRKPSENDPSHDQKAHSCGSDTSSRSRKMSVKTSAAPAFAETNP